jgi:glycyl-tRNA synthetase beta chain
MGAPLLIELLTEELPPKALKKLSDAFAAGIEAVLLKDGLISAQTAPGVGTEVFATPRRLAVLFGSVIPAAQNKAIKQKILPVSVALDAAGNATPALTKKLAGMNLSTLTVADFTREMDGKNETFFAQVNVAGKTLAESLQAAVTESLAKLPIPKTMNYQLADGETTVQFVRPAHRIVALHGERVVPVEALGLKSDRITEGHRFQGEKNISIPAAQFYVDLLKNSGNVIASFEARRAEIERQLKEKASALGFNLGEYDDLLNEVNALVEMPTVYVAQFEKEFLAVPQECLILTMRTNQKYFPLFDASGKLVEKFLLVSNMRLADPKKIIEGNQRVVRPRLADARFFFETDKKTKLETRVPELAKVVYHNQLGSQGERVQRLSALAGEISGLIGADRARAQRAATLMKADLQTLMVGEFPELQGIMGRTYAANDGEAADVAAACDEHYKPRFAGDTLPSAGVPTACALADKLETLAGLFGVGQVPTGDKDPFALRRHALGVLRIVMEQKLNVTLSSLIAVSRKSFESKTLDLTKSPPVVTNVEFAKAPVLINSKLSHGPEALMDFIYDRLRGVLRDQGYTANEVEAVIAQCPDRLDRLSDQLAAVRAFMALPEAQSLAAANKRVANILRKAEESKTEIAPQVQPHLLTDAAEKALHAAMQTTIPAAQNALISGNFSENLKAFAALKTPVDVFFTDVMVMAEDLNVRGNRLALLRDLRSAMNQVADISKLAT